MSGQNGDKPHRPHPTDVAQKSRIRPESVDVVSDSSIPPPSGDEPDPFEDDPLTAWKRRDPNKPVTLDQIHQGLIAVCEVSKAAMESGLKTAADVHELVQTIDQRTHQIAVLTAKVEATEKFAHKIDDEVARNNRLLVEIRRDVQFLKDDMRDVKEQTNKIPAILEILGEILARLPAPQV